jgi:hypothetical protein
MVLKPDDDSCDSKHVAVTILQNNYLLCWLTGNKLNTLTEHNGDTLKDNGRKFMKRTVALDTVLFEEMRFLLQETNL